MHFCVSQTLVKQTKNEWKTWGSVKDSNSKSDLFWKSGFERERRMLTPNHENSPTMSGKTRNQSNELQRGLEYIKGNVEMSTSRKR